MRTQKRENNPTDAHESFGVATHHGQNNAVCLSFIAQSCERDFTQICWNKVVDEKKSRALFSFSAGTKHNYPMEPFLQQLCF